MFLVGTDAFGGDPFVGYGEFLGGAEIHEGIHGGLVGKFIGVL